MVGRPLITSFEKGSVEATKNILEIKNVRAKNDRNLIALKDISLDVKSGEILGIAGVDGNGQPELAEVLIGMRKTLGGKITLDGKDITKLSTQAIRNLGVAYTPEDRMHVGSILEYSVSENLILDKFNSSRFSKGLFMNQSEIDNYAKKLVSDFGIRTPSINVPVKQLSGGNLQKIVLARELSSNPKLIIVHNPTNGLDVGAIEYVHQTLIENRKKGAAILLISTELEEILSLSDRITVLYEGEMMGMVPRDEVDVEKLGLMMGGSKLDSISGESKGEQR